MIRKYELFSTDSEAQLLFLLFIYLFIVLSCLISNLLFLLFFFSFFFFVYIYFSSEQRAAQKYFHNLIGKALECGSKNSLV